MKISNYYVYLEDDDYCLCDSGKLYKECCKKKNIQYGTLGKSYDKKELTYNLSQFLSANKKVDRFIEDRIEEISFYKKISIDDGLRKLKRLYEIIDRALEPIKEISSCSKGCSHCCRGMIVDTTDIEHKIIMEYINNSFSEIEMKKLKGKINVHKKYTQNLVKNKSRYELQHDFSKKNIPCAFLDDQNRCTIYPVRPLKCREYLVFNRPDDCGPTYSSHSAAFKAYNENKVEDGVYILNNITSDMSIQRKHLETWFINSID